MVRWLGKRVIDRRAENRGATCVWVKGCCWGFTVIRGMAILSYVMGLLLQRLLHFSLF